MAGVAFRRSFSPCWSARLGLSLLLLLHLAMLLTGCTPCESASCAKLPVPSSPSVSHCQFALTHSRKSANSISAQRDVRTPPQPLLAFGSLRSVPGSSVSPEDAQRPPGLCDRPMLDSPRVFGSLDSPLAPSEYLSACSGYLCPLLLGPDKFRGRSVAQSSCSRGQDGRRQHSSFLFLRGERGKKLRKQDRLFAAKCPLLNVVDFARLRVPPLTAEALLQREGSSDSAAMQIHASISAAERARAEEEEMRKKRTRRGSGQVEEGHELPPASSVTQLKNYHALLYYATWDSRCQALTNALANLASVACPTLFPLPPTGLGGTAESGTVRRAGGDQDGSSHAEDTEAGPAVSGEAPDGENGEKVEEEREGLRDILDSCIPCWLPVTGICVSNSLVIAAGRRALQKQARMLSNKKQLRHHERALHLMISEGIFYGHGDLPALQVWRREGGRAERGNENAYSRPFALPSLGLDSSVLGDSSLVPGQNPSQSSDARRDGEAAVRSLPTGTGRDGDPKMNLDRPAAGPRDQADCRSTWRKVFEVRGFGPIPLMQLAGGDASAWKEEEKLILTRALLHKSVDSDGSARPREEGILSAGHGGFLSGTGSAQPEEDDLRVWLSQLSSIYQYHAMRTLLQRLRRAEDEFPEFQEFNLRNYNPRLAKLRGLLKD